jgi:hypothetical protein
MRVCVCALETNAHIVSPCLCSLCRYAWCVAHHRIASTASPFAAATAGHIRCSPLARPATCCCSSRVITARRRLLVVSTLALCAALRCAHTIRAAVTVGFARIADRSFADLSFASPVSVRALSSQIGPSYYRLRSVACAAGITFATHAGFVTARQLARLAIRLLYSLTSLSTRVCVFVSRHCSLHSRTLD